MDIVVEEGNADVGNTAEPSYEVVAKSGCSAQLSTNDTDEHELAIESEDSKVSVGNAAKQSHDVVGVGIDCIFNHAKVSTEADLGPQPDVIHLTSLDVPNESSQISSDADMVEQNKKDALDTLIRISQHKKPKKSNVARVVSEDYKCTPEDVQLIEYIKTLPGKQVVVNIDSAWLNRNDMECLFHGDIELSVEVFIPMNIENFHWYMAVLNAKKSEVHVLDSMGQQITDRRDLYTTLKGLERQIKLAAEHKELYQGKWSNLDVASWPVIEKITTQMQTDGVSCGLWMINYMEYWTGSSLSDNVTQILLPFSFMGHFTLYVLNMDTRSIYIMDSMPIPSWFKGDHPSMHYIHNIHYIANNMNAAMELANPTWKDDIYMWRRIVPTWVPRTLNWDLSGFLVINFMHDWNGIRLPCICT
ncbi:hypothetical protein ZEAMMB73_Zm00001d012343, partial [Zea mays]